MMYSFSCVVQKFGKDVVDLEDEGESGAVLPPAPPSMASSPSSAAAGGGAVVHENVAKAAPKAVQKAAPVVGPVVPEKMSREKLSVIR